MRAYRGGKKGFTLVEFIIAVVLLGIIVALLVPRITGMVEYSRTAADQATVRVLNSATAIYRVNSSFSDPFRDQTKSNNDLLQLLVDEKYVINVPKPQTKDAEYAWLFASEKWYLLFEDSFYVISLLDGVYFRTNYYKNALDGTYTASAKDIVIPSVIDGVTIQEIYQDVFSNNNLTAVAFAEGNKIERIHARAFENNNLSELVLPDSLQRIDLRAFRNNGLTELNIPPSVHTIEWQAFQGNDIKKITLGSAVSIGNGALGTYTDEYIMAYQSGGAGSYLYSDGSWSKQDP